MKTVDLLDAVRKKHHLTSDYQAAKLLGLTQAQVSRYRNGKDFMGDEVALMVAGLLGEDAAIILANLHAERSKDDASRAVWRGIAQRLKGGAIAAGVAMFCGGFTGGPDGGAIAAPLPGDQGQSVYYVKLQRDPISTDPRQLTVVVQPRTRLAVDLKKLHSRHDSLVPTLFSGCCASRRNGLIV